MEHSNLSGDGNLPEAAEQSPGMEARTMSSVLAQGGKKLYVEGEMRWPPHNSAGEIAFLHTVGHDLFHTRLTDLLTSSPSSNFKPCVETEMLLCRAFADHWSLFVHQPYCTTIGERDPEDPRVAALNQGVGKVMRASLKLVRSYSRYTVAYDYFYAMIVRPLFNTFVRMQYDMVVDDREAYIIILRDVGCMDSDYEKRFLIMDESNPRDRMVRTLTLARKWGVENNVGLGIYRREEARLQLEENPASLTYHLHLRHTKLPIAKNFVLEYTHECRYMGPKAPTETKTESPEGREDYEQEIDDKYDHDSLYAFPTVPFVFPEVPVASNEVPFAFPEQPSPELSATEVLEPENVEEEDKREPDFLVDWDITAERTWPEYSEPRSVLPKPAEEPLDPESTDDADTLRMLEELTGNVVSRPRGRSRRGRA